MNRQNIIALCVAGVIGLVAVFLANSYFSGIEKAQEDEVRATRLTRIAVALQDIPLGTALTNTNVRMADWPANSVPPGSFDNFGAATTNRIALEAIRPGEPIIAGRISGTDGRATLATRLDEDRYAISVAVNAVTGVSGFVRPGDLVDVLLTRQIPGDGAKSYDKMTDVIARGLPVLAIDQVLDRSKTDPALGSTATLEVSMEDAQRLSLARELGTLSLALRNVASPANPKAATVTMRDLGGRQLYIGNRSSAPAAAKAAPAAAPAPAPRKLAPPRHSSPTMTVIRKGVPTTYEVKYVY